MAVACVKIDNKIQHAYMAYKDNGKIYTEENITPYIRIGQDIFPYPILKEFCLINIDKNTMCSGNRFTDGSFGLPKSKKFGLNTYYPNGFNRDNIPDNITVAGSTRDSAFGIVKEKLALSLPSVLQGSVCIKSPRPFYDGNLYNSFTVQMSFSVNGLWKFHDNGFKPFLFVLPGLSRLGMRILNRDNGSNSFQLQLHMDDNSGNSTPIGNPVVVDNKTVANNIALSVFNGDTVFVYLNGKLAVKQKLANKININYEPRKDQIVLNVDDIVPSNPDFTMSLFGQQLLMYSLRIWNNNLDENDIIKACMVDRLPNIAANITTVEEYNRFNIKACINGGPGSYNNGSQNGHGTMQRDFGGGNPWLMGAGQDACPNYANVGMQYTMPISTYNSEFREQGIKLSFNFYRNHRNQNRLSDIISMGLNCNPPTNGYMNKASLFRVEVDDRASSGDKFNGTIYTVDGETIKWKAFWIDKTDYNKMHTFNVTIKGEQFRIYLDGVIIASFTIKGGYRTVTANAGTNGNDLFIFQYVGSSRNWDNNTGFMNATKYWFTGLVVNKVITRA